ASELHVGDEILIVGAKDDVALSAAQNANNRGVASVVIDGNKVIAPSDAVQRITLEDGIVPGEYALQVGSGYLYFATGGNNLRTKESVDATASWDIEIRNITEDSHGTGDIAFIQEKTDGRYIRCNGGDLFSAYGASSGTSYIKIYRKDREADNTPRFNVTLPEGNTVSADAQTVPVYVFGNVAWTASVTGGATLDKTSGNGNDILTLTVPANGTSSPKDYVVTVSTTASVATPSFGLTLTQAKPVTDAIPVGSVLFYETWAGGAADQTPSAYLASGDASTEVYGNKEVAYAQTKTTRLCNDGLIDVPGTYSGTLPMPELLLNLLISKANGTWTISGIPCTGVKTAHLTFRCNYGSKQICSSSSAGVSFSDVLITNETSAWGKKVYTYSYDISFDASKSLDIFALTFENTDANYNHRVDQIRLVVTEVEGGASPTSYGHGGTFGDE
ncbi:MAG: BACON domain-containing protein, partial [Bacteroidales bacterium]|nr:BACON domain-containing protein [Bacteroidales bacterium]